MEKKEIKEIIKKEIVPYLIGLRNEISDNKKNNHPINVDGKQILIQKGDDGYTPEADVDYPSEKTVIRFIKDNLPKRGEDYFTQKDIKDIVNTVYSLLPNKEELKGDKGDTEKIDYSVVRNLALPLIKEKHKEIRLEIANLADKTIKAIKDNKVNQLTTEEIVKKLQGVKGRWLSADSIKGLEKYVNKFVAISSSGGGSGGFQITVSATAPSSPYVNQLWYDIS